MSEVLDSSPNLAKENYDYQESLLEADGTYDQIEKKHVAEAEQSAQDSAQFVQKNAKEGNQDILDASYQAEQASERAGWTKGSGYLADTQKQTEYLKQSIAAEVYNQFELQKKGYDTQLEAARSAAQLEKEQLAIDRSRAALDDAVKVGQAIGFFTPPHLKDMVTQYKAASDTIDSEKDPESREYKRAQKVKGFIENYMTENYSEYLKKEGEDYVITPPVIKTLAQQELEITKAYNQAEIDLREHELEMDEYKQEDAAAKERLEPDSPLFIPEFDEEGNAYSNTSELPHDEKKIGFLKDHYKNNEAEFENLLGRTIANYTKEAQAYAAKKKKKIEELNEEEVEELRRTVTFSGYTLDEMLDTFSADGKDSYSALGVPIVKTEDGWYLSETQEEMQERTEEEKKKKKKKKEKDIVDIHNDGLSENNIWFGQRGLHEDDRFSIKYGGEKWRVKAGATVTSKFKETLTKTAKEKNIDLKNGTPMIHGGELYAYGAGNWYKVVSKDLFGKDQYEKLMQKLEDDGRLDKKVDDVQGQIEDVSFDRRSNGYSIVHFSGGGKLAMNPSHRTQEKKVLEYAKTIKKAEASFEFNGRRYVKDGEKIYKVPSESELIDSIQI